MVAYHLESLFHFKGIFNSADGNLPIFIIDESGSICSSNAIGRGYVGLHCRSRI